MVLHARLAIKRLKTLRAWSPDRAPLCGSATVIAQLDPREILRISGDGFIRSTGQLARPLIGHDLHVV